MAAQDLTFKVRLESQIVELVCMAQRCKYWRANDCTCNLKQVVISADGQCKSYETTS